MLLDMFENFALRSDHSKIFLSLVVKNSKYFKIKKSVWNYASFFNFPDFGFQIFLFSRVLLQRFPPFSLSAPLLGLLWTNLVVCEPCSTCLLAHISGKPTQRCGVRLALCVHVSQPFGGDRSQPPPVEPYRHFNHYAQARNWSQGPRVIQTQSSRSARTGRRKGKGKRRRGKGQKRTRPGWKKAMASTLITRFQLSLPALIYQSTLVCIGY